MCTLPLKFIYSEKATKFCKINFSEFLYSEKATKFFEISTADLSYVVPVKSTVEISQKKIGLLRIYKLYKSDMNTLETGLTRKNMYLINFKHKYPSLSIVSMFF